MLQAPSLYQTRYHLVQPRPVHSGSKNLKPAGKKFDQYNFLRIQMASVSGNCVHYIFIICQIIEVMSMICQFYEFFKSHFWRFFDVWPNCAVQWNRGLVLAAVICNTFDGTLHNFDIVASDLESFA